ncbi:hypothetical protein HY440_03380, partial [Candidatus Microgenomates bacterium]|nr:hypothetical protein [Candidatus Microgenomates bacterium]
MKLKSVSSRKIIASFGNETVEATLTFDDGTSSTASIPAGISAGKYEVAKVAPDQAINQIGQIGQICVGSDWTQETLDAAISSHGFGGNATLAVSAAFFKSTIRYPLTAIRFPKLFLLLFEGGKHGNPNLTIQEFCLVEDSVSQAEFDFKKLREHLTETGVETLVGAEGAFSPANFDNAQAIESIKTLFRSKPIALDLAGSFGQTTMNFTAIFSVEDPYDDESWEKFAALNATGQLLVIGDDLTTTNPVRIQKAIDQKAIGGVVIKPNQIGTISAALEAVKLAQSAGLKIIVSHRGEETDDTWIVDFALAAKADYVKFGGMERGERVAKYNR